MKYSYDITGAEVILRDYPVYDAANLDQGELLMMGTTDPDVGADESLALITAYDATAANSAINAVGILNDLTYEVGGTVPDRLYSTATGPYYGKVIINPFMVYSAEHSLAAADDQAITSTAAATLTVNLLADDIDGYYAYFPETASGVKGSLRFILASAAGSCTMASALTTAGTATDTVVLIAPPTHYSFNLTADAKGISSSDCQNIQEATNLRILQTYIDKNAGEEILTPASHQSLDNLDQCREGVGPKFIYKIMLKDHLFGVQE